MRSAVKIICVTAVMAFAVPAFAQQATPTDISMAIKAQVTRIQTAPTPELRQKAVQDLFTLTRDKDPRTVDDAAIDAMAALVYDDPARTYDDQDLVAASTASAIANLGPRAKRAAPALVQAIAAKHRDVGQPTAGLDGATILCDKLKNITFEPLPQDCDWWLYGTLPPPDAKTRVQALKPLS